MTDRNTLYEGVSHAAWGYLFYYLDINLGTVSILPRFVGCLLLLSAIRCLSEERRDLALLRPFGILLTLWSGADWIASWMGRTLDEWFLPLNLVVSVASLYFHFQLFTDLAALAAAYQQPGDNLDRRLLRWRTVHVALTTSAALAAACLPAVDIQIEYFIFLAVIAAPVALCLMAALFSLRKLFQEGTDTLRT